MKTLQSTFAALLLLTACDSDVSLTGYDDRFKIKNNSGRTIYYSAYISSPEVINDELDICLKREVRRVEPDSYKIYGAYHNWEWYINNLPDSQLTIFIYDADQIDSISDCAIVMANLHADKFVLKRYDVTTAYLKSHDWTIVHE